MSKYDKPIKEWNAITYLRDFINTYLVLSHREQAVWDFLQKSHPQDEDSYYRTKPKPKKLKSGTMSTKYRCCMRCGEIKTLNHFEGLNNICIECRKSEKRICKQKIQ